MDKKTLPRGGILKGDVHGGGSDTQLKKMTSLTSHRISPI